MTKYHLYDIGDSFVYFSGSLADCQKVQDESYAGLIIITDEELKELENA